MPVVITSYEIAMRDRKALQRVNFKYMVIDEGHRLKNSNCRLVRELKQIPAENKLLLTGLFIHYTML
jgi:ATP-dependent DNA helicase